MSSIKKKYNLLNVMRLFAAFSVITIHIHFPGTFGTVMIDIARYAVPFFFMASGFFSYYDSSIDTLSKIKRKIKHISIVYIGAAALYSTYKLLGMGTAFIKRVFSLVSVAEFFLFNMPESSEHLWFLPALIYTYIIFYFFEKFKITKKMYFLIPLLFGLGVAFREIFFIFGYPFETLKNGYIYRNFLVLGIPFFLLGHYIRANEEKLKAKLSNSVLIIAIIVGTVEAIAVGHLHFQKNIYLGTFVAVFMIFVFVIKNEEKIKIPLLASMGEKHSLYIYILHQMINNTIKKLGDFIPIIDRTYELLTPVMPFIIFAITLCASAVYVYAKTKIKSGINRKKTTP